MRLDHNVFASDKFGIFRLEFLGGFTGGATPVPIPNTEVKPSRADDTMTERSWESRTLPGLKMKAHQILSDGLFYFIFKTLQSVVKEMV